MTRRSGDKFQQKGWTYLPYKFSAEALVGLSALNPHMGRGKRLTDMTALSIKLPSGFKTTLAEVGFNPTPLRAVGFNKSNQVNWSLPWHQDRIIAMPSKTPHPELKNWSRKSDVWHCEPSASILAQMAFAYIAFDEVSEDMGGLEIAEGTHKFGAIRETKINAHIQTAKTTCPKMEIGDVLFVSALSLHRSAAMKIGGDRRALRIDFAADALNLAERTVFAPHLS